MKALRRPMLPITLLLCIAVACQDSAPPESVSNSPTGKRNARVTSLDYSSIQNPNNFMSLFGEIHNDGLDYILLHTVPDSTYVTTAEDIANLTVAFIDSISDSLTSADLGALKAIALMATDSLRIGNLSQAYITMGLEVEAINYCNQIVSTTQSPALHNLSSMLSALSTVENSIIASTTLTNTQKWLPLAMVATAKHSALYHSQFFDVGGTSLQSNPADKHSRAIQGKSEEENWKDVLESDVVGAAWGALGGFFGGGVAGFVIGSFGGPIGTLGGAAGGAIGGSLVGAVSGGIVSSGKRLMELDGHKRPLEQ